MGRGQTGCFMHGTPSAERGLVQGRKMWLDGFLWAAFSTQPYLADCNQQNNTLETQWGEVGRSQPLRVQSHGPGKLGVLATFFLLEGGICLPRVH